MILSTVRVPCASSAATTGNPPVSRDNCIARPAEPKRSVLGACLLFRSAFFACLATDTGRRSARQRHHQSSAVATSHPRHPICSKMEAPPSPSCVPVAPGKSTPPPNGTRSRRSLARVTVRASPVGCFGEWPGTGSPCPSRSSS